ncbi:25244_t:CDS:2, partial [Cetraspora pellucida]
MQCFFLINASCSKINNSEGSVIVNKIIFDHNHPVNHELVEFENAKKFTNSMLENVKFITVFCKFGAMPTAKSLFNDAAQISNWLDQQKENNSHWIMKPEKVENWIHYSDCVLNNVTHKTNHYSMALSLIVGFNNNHQNILLAQALLADEIKAINIQPLVILIDTDPAINTAIYQDEINQLVYYVANKVISVNIKSLDDENLQFSLQKHSANDLQTTLKQMIELVKSDNIKKIWAINIGNLLKTKHYIILLHNSNAKFHIWLLPSQWFCTNEIRMKEPFLATDKFSEKKVTYGKLHGIYKKALCKALQKHTKSQQLISLLQDFVNKSDESNSNSQQDNDSVNDDYSINNVDDKKENIIPLKNPKMHHNKGRPTEMWNAWPLLESLQ